MNLARAQCPFTENKGNLHIDGLNCKKYHSYNHQYRSNKPVIEHKEVHAAGVCKSMEVI